MMTRLGVMVLALLCLPCTVPDVCRAQPPASGLTLGAAAAALRDSVPVFEDAAFQRPVFTLRLGDAAPYRGRTDSTVIVGTPRGGTGYARLRDVGLIGLPAVRDGEVLEYSRRFQPYVLWYLARRFAAARVADQWAVPPDPVVGRRMYARLVHEFPADSLVPVGLKVPDMHVRFGAIEGNLRQAEMDLAAGDTAQAVVHLLDAVDHYPALARVSSLDALFLSMAGNFETRSLSLDAATRARGERSLFRVLREHPRDVVRGLSGTRVPAFEAAEMLLDLRRFPARDVLEHSVQIVRIDSLAATRMMAWVARGRLELARGRVARAESLGLLAARGQPDWMETAPGQGPPLDGNPRPAMKLLTDTWRARGGRLAGLRALRALAFDPSLSEGVRHLAQQELATALDHGPGSVEEIRALGLAAEDQAWRARLEAGGWSARVTAPAPALRAGDWDSAAEVGQVAAGETVRVLAVAATWPGPGVAPHHRVKVQKADGVIGWTDSARLTRLAPAAGAPMDSAVAHGAVPRRARVVVAPPQVGLAPPVTAAGRDVAVSQFAFDADAAAPANPAGLIDGDTGQVAWIRPIDGMTLPSTLHVLRAPRHPDVPLAVIAPGDNSASILEATQGGVIGTVSCAMTLAAATPPALVTSGDVLYTLERSALSATRVLPDSTFALLWTVPLEESWSAVPPIAAGGLRAESLGDSLLLTASGGGNPRLRAWSMRDGHVLWTSPSPDAADLFVGGPGVVLAYAGVEMWAVAARTGALLWNQHNVGTGDPFAALITRPAVILPDRILQLSNRTLLALDARTGELRWSTALPQAAVSAPALVPGQPQRVVVALSQGLLAYIDVTDGHIVTLQALRTWSNHGPTPAPGSPAPRWTTAHLATTADALVVSADDGIVDILGPAR